MDIETVKIQGDGWLVNDSLSVPNDSANRHCQEVQLWLETNTPISEFTQTELDDGHNAVIDAELIQIDLASIRSLREWVASQPDAPQWIIDKENEAQSKRAERKS